MPKSHAHRRTLKRSTQKTAPSTAPKLTARRQRATTPGDLAHRRRLHAVLDGIDAVLIAFDRRGRCTHLNRKGEQLLGEKREKLLGCPVLQKFPELVHSGIPRLFQRALKTGKMAALEAFCPRRQIWMEISLRPLPDEVWVCLRDVTERRRIEKQLASVLLRNQHLEGVEPLAGSVAHDLNNILAPILMSIDILKSMVNDSQANLILETIEMSAQRGGGIVRQVLSFARGLKDNRVEAPPALLPGNHIVSKLDRGMTFKTYASAPAKFSGARRKKVKQAGLPRGNGETILVVDDEGPLLAITTQTLAAFGYQVLTAGDGAEAVAVYVQHKDEIAVVITDMVMPIMDGPATAHALKKINSAVKIIAVSGLYTNENIANASGAGVNHFLTKPYAAGTLLETLRKVLDEE